MYIMSPRVNGVHTCIPNKKETLDFRVDTCVFLVNVGSKAKFVFARASFCPERLG